MSPESIALVAAIAGGGFTALTAMFLAWVKRPRDKVDDADSMARDFARDSHADLAYYRKECHELRNLLNQANIRLASCGASPVQAHPDPVKPAEPPKET